MLGSGAKDAERAELKAQIDAALQQMKKMSDLENNVAAQSVEEGYGRLDALNRIGNQVFSVDLNDPGNYAPHSAPVHYPRIWNAPWFSWVQYNGSIEQPIVRNVGEALGVSADLNLTRADKGIYASSAHIKTLAEIEQTIAGEQPTAERGFSGLKSPGWPKDVLPAIDEQKAAAWRRSLQGDLPGLPYAAGEKPGILSVAAMAGAECRRRARARSGTYSAAAHRH